MLENQYLLAGQDPGVYEGQDHNIHTEIHQQIELPQDNPMAYQQALAAVNQHVQGHQQALAQEMEMAGTPAPRASSTGPTGIQEAVQSNAQRTAHAVQREVREQ
jgi:hypothetical protein